MRCAGRDRYAGVGVCGRDLVLFAVECENESSIHGQSRSPGPGVVSNAPLGDGEMLFLIPVQMIGRHFFLLVPWMEGINHLVRVST